MNLGEAVAFTGISDKGYKLLEEVCTISVRYGMGLQSAEEVQRHLVKLAMYVVELEGEQQWKS